jgi:hypothetical protein
VLPGFEPRPMDAPCTVILVKQALPLKKRAERHTTLEAQDRVADDSQNSLA